MNTRTAFLGLSLCITASFAEAQYTLTKLDGLFPVELGFLASAHMNNFDQIVVGTRLWDHGVINKLSIPEGIGFTTGINDKGQIIGYSIANDSGQNHTTSLVWQNGSRQELPILFDGYAAIPEDINQKGQIVGSSRVPGVDLRAVSWSSPTSTPVELGALPGQTASYAQAVNDKGDVAGVSMPWLGAGFSHRGFLDQGGTLTPITDYALSDVRIGDMNNRGTIVGYRDSVGFVFSEGVTTPIENFGGPFSYASAVNEFDEVVGRSSDVNGTLHPFFWKNGVLTNLGLILKPQMAPGLTLSIAWDINDRGDFLLSDNRNDLYLARALEPHDLPTGFTPVPEIPTFSVFGGIGLVLFAWFRRRR